MFSEWNEIPREGESVVEMPSCVSGGCWCDAGPARAVLGKELTGSQVAPRLAAGSLCETKRVLQNQIWFPKASWPTSFGALATLGD